MSLPAIITADRYTLHRGDCVHVLRTLPDCSVHAIVTDPPYGLKFMGNRWDYDVPKVEVWAQCLRVLKPGGHLLSFAGTRTHHRMACRIEDAGFEIRDMIAWVYGQGFPKSLNLDAEWEGYGTALKPALEPITLARKPIPGTVAANLEEHGCGALNIDGCRVGSTVESWPASRSYAPGQKQPGHLGLTQTTGKAPPGRWPANFIHDGSPEVVGVFPYTSSGRLTPEHQRNAGYSSESPCHHGGSTRGGSGLYEASEGSASRFFYCAKASKADREEGLELMPSVHRSNGNKWTDQDYRVQSGERSTTRESGPRRNKHPTVKPTDLMRYLCRLVTPPGGTVLDPFMGSGSTGKAAMREGFRFIGIDRDTDDHGQPAGFLKLAAARLAHAARQFSRKPQPPCNPLSDPGKP